MLGIVKKFIVGNCIVRICWICSCMCSYDIFVCGSEVGEGIVNLGIEGGGGFV